MTGHLAAYYHGEFITSKPYKSGADIGRVKEQWKKLYGKRFEQMTFVDTPNPPKEKKVILDADGTEHIPPDKSISKKGKNVNLPKIYKPPKPSTKTRRTKAFILKRKPFALSWQINAITFIAKFLSYGTHGERGKNLNPATRHIKCPSLDFTR